MPFEPGAHHTTISKGDDTCCSCYRTVSRGAVLRYRWRAAESPSALEQHGERSSVEEATLSQDRDFPKDGTSVMSVSSCQHRHSAQCNLGEAHTHASTCLQTEHITGSDVQTHGHVRLHIAGGHSHGDTHRNSTQQDTCLHIPRPGILDNMNKAHVSSVLCGR